ncbi:hypothetical protein [Chitinophaga flava]|nr:hypothetical protein [Chitinophaga flava]
MVSTTATIPVYICVEPYQLAAVICPNRLYPPVNAAFTAILLQPGSYYLY